MPMANRGRQHRRPRRATLPGTGKAPAAWARGPVAEWADDRPCLARMGRTSKARTTQALTRSDAASAAAIVNAPNRTQGETSRAEGRRQVPSAAGWQPDGRMLIWSEPSGRGRESEAEGQRSRRWTGIPLPRPTCQRAGRVNTVRGLRHGPPRSHRPDRCTVTAEPCVVPTAPITRSGRSPRRPHTQLTFIIEEIERLLNAAAGATSDASARAAARPRLGAVSFLHRFGSALNRYVHLHVCAKG